MDGYLALLVGQKVPYHKPYQPSLAEQAVWRKHCQQLAADAHCGMGVKEALDALRSPGLNWA
ncbi:MAG: hypothetical protein DME26_00920 [Verrucomicrobia bacterium]|nr:MAG: hypothetical protein DME26_00920 [Verrucomicrobiota bacterium]